MKKFRWYSYMDQYDHYRECSPCNELYNTSDGKFFNPEYADRIFVALKRMRNARYGGIPIVVEQMHYIATGENPR